MAQRFAMMLCGAALLSACDQNGAGNAPAAENATEASAEAPASAESDPAVQEALALKSTAPEGTFEEYPFGTVRRAAIWNEDGWTQASEKPIAVCWENPAAVPEAMRRAVQDAVKQTWEKVSMVRFTGWQTCTSDRTKENIRIYAADQGPHVKTLGRYLDDYPRGMVLNFQFAKWSQDCQQRIEFCARVVGVHEFGHALGFAHEQNRDDAPFQCRAESQGTKGDWNITTYDPDSIMNYCNVKWNNNGNLSARDILAVTTLYGRRA